MTERPDAPGRDLPEHPVPAEGHDGTAAVVPLVAPVVDRGLRARAGELLLVAGVAALGVFVLVDATTIRIPGSVNTIGPRFFPYLVGGLLVATAIALGVQIVRGRVAPPEDSEDVDTHAGTDWRTVALVTAGFGAHALLIEPIGWPLAVTLLFSVVALALGARRPVLTVAAGLAISIVAWLVFVLGLGVGLPGGPLEWVVYG